jgi:trimeric autotransporter adhesin
MVVGGYYNLASGFQSFAAGTQAKTQTPGPTPTVHQGAFVWADGNFTDFNTEANHEFAARATGGVRFVTAIDGSGNPTRTVKINPNAELDFGSQTRQMLNLWGSAQYGVGVQTGTLYFRANPVGAGGFAWYRGGVHNDNVFSNPGGDTLMTLDEGGNLTTLGTINGLSDAARKIEFSSIDSRDVLARVVAMPIATWRYRDDAHAARHMGPTAQDFAAAFKLGSDDKHIAMVDADGVALAAIQGLNAKLEAKIAEQAYEIAQLKRAVGMLLARVPDGPVAAAR